MVTERIRGNAPQSPDLSSLDLGITKHAPLPMALMDGATHIVRYANPAFCRLMDRPAEQLVGKAFCEMLPEKDECLALLDRVFRTGNSESHAEQENSGFHPPFWSFTMWPVLADERPVGVMIQVTETARHHETALALNQELLLGSLHQHELTETANALNVQLQAEIAERKQVEVALRLSEGRFRTLFELGPVAVYSCDARGLILEFNHRSAELWGRTPTLGETDERFCGSFKLFRTDGCSMPHAQSPMAEVIAGKIASVRDAEILIERPNGSRVPVLVNILPLKNERGEITGAINCFYDITERKEAEQRQEILMNELAHRGKNLLAVVQSIASLTLTGSRSLAEGREILTRRIQALARSQAVFGAPGLEGVSITEILRLELEGFSDQVGAVGPDIVLRPRAAQTFAMLVHELATNATKYGALSLMDGRVAVGWSVEGAGAEAQFKFQWQEHNGPRVVPPTRRGFGRMLLEKVAVQDFGTGPKISFAPEGVRYEIDAPLSRVAAGGAGKAPDSS